MDVEGDDLLSVSRGMSLAASRLKECEVRRKGLGMFFFDQDGKDIGCMMPWAGARDWLFIDNTE